MEVGVLTLQAIELVGHDHLRTGISAVNEFDAGRWCAFEQPARDGHARRDAAAGGKQQDVFGRWPVDDVEFAGWRQRAQHVAGLQMVEEVVRDLAADNALDGD